MRRRSSSLALRRLAQTPAAFTNWPEVLAGLARGGMGRGPETLRFQARSGQQITVPNAPGARVPAYELFAEDCYDLAWFLGDLAHRPVHVLDIGAHVGTFTCLLCGVNPDATVDCFEPSADTATYTRRNVTDNDLDERVTVHEAALAGTTGWALFEQEGAGSGHNHLVHDDGTSGVRVRTLAFDEVVAGTRAPVEVVKMDCEGGEYDLVYQSDPESWSSVQRLVLEYHRVEGQSWARLRSWFADVGLHVLREDSVSPGIGLAWLSRDPVDDDPDPVGGALWRLAYVGRRVVQTPRAFSNWPELLSGMSTRRFRSGSPTVTFESRSGLTLETPNVPGARLPAYEQFAEDAYRLDWFLGSLRDRPLHAIDVGAHVGMFACRFADLHPTATMTCFEPSEGAAALLRRNLARNGLDDRVTVEQAALTGAAGWADFDDHGDASVHSGLVHEGATSNGTTVEVRTLGFDDVVAASPHPIEFVKLDCEGGEYELARQSTPQNWATVQRVVLEYHDVPGASWADLRAWFSSVGLHVVRLAPIRTNLGTAWLARDDVR